MEDYQGKLNLPSIQFFEFAGDEDQLVTYLNCFQTCLYHNLKMERNYDDQDLLEIFLGDMTFSMIENTAGSIYDIGFLEGSVNQFGFKTNYVLGKGIEVLHQVEALLDQGKAVIIQTCMQRVPFFLNFIGYDYVMDEEHYRQNHQNYHTFLVLSHDRDHLYYVESPYTYNKERYIPYEGNKTIGVIEKKELIPAFSVFFNYTYLTFDEQQPTDKLDIIKMVTAKSIKNFHLPTYHTGDKIHYYGKEVLVRLSNHFQSDSFDLYQHVEQFDLKLDHLLIWKLQFVINRRYLMARVLEKYTERLMPLDISGLIEILNNDIKTWRILVARLKKMQAKKVADLDASFLDVFERISLLENEIIVKLKILE